MTLAWVGQEEFSAGILRASARGSEPGVGVITARNGLFDDDGDIYRRGGDKFVSNLADGPITFMWSGYLNDVAKTIVATATKTYSYVAGTLTQIAATGVPRPVLPAIVGEKLWLPNGKSWDGGAALGAWAVHAHVAAIADRLVVADGNRVAFTGAGTTVFDPTDYHELPDGVAVMGLMAIRDSLLVFTNYGLWAIENMAYDLTDAEGNVQQAVSRITPELSLLSEAGLCEWAGKIVAPCADRVYLVDTVSAPIPISDSIAPLYMGFVGVGNKPGGAKVFRNHLFMPMLDSLNTVTGMLVCRLNRPVRGRFIYYPWSIFDGHAGNSLTLDVSMLGAAPRLFAGNRDARLSDLTDVFNPGDLNAADAVGTHEFELQTRDFPTGNGQPNHTKRLRLYYTLKGSGTIEAAYSVGTVTQNYETLWESVVGYQQVVAAYLNYEAVARGGETSYVTTPDDPDRWWQGLTPQAVASGGVDPANWNLKRAERARFIRAWFRCTNPVDTLVVHRVEFGVRPATHQR